MKYLITYENAHWCGGELNVVVNASSKEDAVDKASMHMEEAQRELFDDHYNDEDDESYGYLDDEQAYSVVLVEEFNEKHSEWVYYINPGQAEFYPEIK